jgi:hypothetical protein
MRDGAWGAPRALLWTPATASNAKGTMMAEEEPLLVSPPTQDVAMHVRDYERFTKMFKWGALTCLVIGFVVLLILK